MRSGKAQSTLDFITANLGVLMLVLLLVILLFYIGIANTGMMQERCDLGAPFTCKSFEVDSGFGLALRAGQAGGSTAIVEGISCEPPASATMDFHALESPVSIPHGEFRDITGGDSGNRLYCTGAKKGEVFMGRICLLYLQAETGMNRTACGNVIAQVR